MLTLPFLTFILAMTPALVSAAIFPKNSQVKMLDPKGFKKHVLNADHTTMVAFVAPWCGHCQRMAPEYSKAATGLHPLVPVYAVDCDAENNKRLCNDQGVRGFPTVKLFPRGKSVAPMTYESGERTATAFFSWASRRVPYSTKQLSNVEHIDPWIKKTQDEGKPRALLLMKDKKVPLLWKVLGNKFKDQLEFASHHDNKGKSSIALGFEAGGEKASKVLIYPEGQDQPILYQGANKFEALTNFFQSLLDGSLDLGSLNDQSDKVSASDEDQVVFDANKEEL